MKNFFKKTLPYLWPTFKWGSFVVFFLILFTLFKLPKEKLHVFLDGYLKAAAAKYGVFIKPKKTSLSLMLPSRYTLKNVELFLPFFKESLKLERISLSTQILPLFLGTFSGTLSLKNKKNILPIQFSIQPQKIQLHLAQTTLNLETSPVFETLLGTFVQGTLKGRGSFEGNLSQTRSFRSFLFLKGKNIFLSAHTEMGFQIPDIHLSKIQVRAFLKKGKLFLKTAILGTRTNPKDTFYANISGKIILTPILEQSRLDLSVQLWLSKELEKAFPFIKTFLQFAKKPKQSLYRFYLKGTASLPLPQAAP